MTTFLQLTYGGAFLLRFLPTSLACLIPSVVFLMAAGALSAHGGMNPSIIVALGVLGCLAGDGIWFWIGRKWGSKAMRLLCRFTADPRNCSRNAQKKFRRYGLPVLCVAKFLPGLDAAHAATLRRGRSAAHGFPCPRYGRQLPLVSVYVGLGYLFSNQLDVAIRWAQHFGTALGFAIGIPIVLYAGWRGLALVQNDPSTAAAPHQSADARTQTEIQEQGRRARPVELRRRNRQVKAWRLFRALSA